MIVTRGLGFGGTLVTFGLAISLGVIVLPPEPRPPELVSYNQGPQRRFNQVVATIRIPAVVGEGLLAAIEAKGAASIGLYVPDAEHSVSGFVAVGAARASIIGIKAETSLGQILAQGQHDLEDEDILAMLLSMLES